MSQPPQGPPAQPWSPPPTNYSYPSAPPPGGYYSYPPPIPQGGPPPPGNPQYYGAPQYSYAYAPPAGYYPPPPAGYVYPPPVPQATPAAEPEKPKEPEKVTYKFVRADHKGWHVVDESGAVAFNVLYKKGGMFKEDGCEVHHGESGPLLAAVYDEKITAGGHTSDAKKSKEHNDFLVFTDPHDRQYGFGEVKGKGDLLIYYSTNEAVAEGHVNIHKNEGTLIITDPKNAPDAPILIAAYVELLRLQQKHHDDEAFNKGFKTSFTQNLLRQSFQNAF